MRQTTNLKLLFLSSLLWLGTTIFCSLNVKAQTMDEVLSKIFFNANLSKKDSLIQYFNANKLLSVQPDSIFSKNQLADAPVDLITYYAYGFKAHPYFTENLLRGKIVFYATKFEARELILNLSTQLYIKNAAAQDSLFMSLSNFFEKSATKKILSTGLLLPDEAVQFTGLRNQIVIITKIKFQDNYILNVYLDLRYH